MFLSLKTNLLRQEMTEREQGKVLHQITESFNISSNELAKRIGKNHMWVSRRIKMGLDLKPVVARALEEGKITMQIAEIIANVAPQQQFLLYIYIIHLTK